jgi:phage terminase large subunit
MFKVTKSIRQILKLTKRYRVIQGGARAGKTYAIISILIDTACRQIKSKTKIIDIVSMTYNHLEMGAINDFKKIMKYTNRWQDKSWNETKHTYKFHNGTVIRFYSIDDEGKARGPERDILYINEANQVHFEIADHLCTRTNDYIYLDYNPSSEFWAHSEILTQDNAELLILTYRDNSALNENIRNELLDKRKKAESSEYWANWCKVYLDGQVGKLQGAIFQNWNIIDKIPDEARLIAYGLDWGFTNDFTSCVGVYKYNDDIILDEVLYEKQLVNQQIADRLKAKGIDNRFEIYCDSAEPKSIRELSYFGLRTYSADKGKDSVNFGISLMQTFKLIVTKQSINLIDELYKYSWRTDTSGKSLNTPIDRDNHAIDAARYVFQSKLSKIGNGGGMTITVR